MGNEFRPSSFFFLLLFLCMYGNLAREMAKGAEKNIETVYDPKKQVSYHPCLNHGHDVNNNYDEHDDDDDDDGHGCHKEMIHDFHEHIHDHTPSSHMDNINPSSNIFFHIDDLKNGGKFPLYFPIKKPSSINGMISKKEANSIPFSLAQLPKILELFSFSQDSPQAKAIKHTLMHCELPPIKGETKFCATSLESMLEKLGQIFGFSTNFKVLSTTQMRKLKTHLQNYTILEDPMEIITTKMVGCHPVPYPYAVFYCHGQESDKKLFMISLESEVDELRVEAIAICHMDTSKWDPDHVSFRLLGIQPGTSPVCHVFPQDNLVWVSSSPSSSVN